MEKCDYCGRYNENRLQCYYCGAPLIIKKSVPIDIRDYKPVKKLTIYR